MVFEEIAANHEFGIDTMEIGGTLFTYSGVFLYLLRLGVA
jgi:hypothetical protein